MKAVFTIVFEDYSVEVCKSFKDIVIFLNGFDLISAEGLKSKDRRAVRKALYNIPYGSSIRFYRPGADDWDIKVQKHK